MDDDLAPAVLDHLRSKKRGAVHLAWLGPLGVPMDAIPEEVGLALGGVAMVMVAWCSYRWLRSNPSSPLRREERSSS